VTALRLQDEFRYIIFKIVKKFFNEIPLENHSLIISKHNLLDEFYIYFTSKKKKKNYFYAKKKINLKFKWFIFFSFLRIF
jgi:hypothetical protein